MAQTMLLKNVLNRRPMIAYPEQYSIQRDDFEITLADFAQSEIIDKLYKADNQRSTEYWSLRDIIRFINACTTDPNAWLTFLYWKDQQGNMYLIDGGIVYRASMRGSNVTLLMSKSRMRQNLLRHKRRVTCTA